MCISEYVSLDDLFLAGVAFDIVGAALLAKGLLLSNRQTWWLTDTIKGQQMGVEDRSQNKALALFGLLTLGIGFALQAFGYLLEIRGDEIEMGHARFIGGLITVAVAALIACLPWVSLVALRRGLSNDRCEVSGRSSRPKRRQTTNDSSATQELIGAPRCRDLLAPAGTDF